MQLLEKQIHKFLIKNNKSLSVAESCTGGLLSSLLTRSSGSSRYFKLGVVTYSNQAKHRILSIPVKMMKQKGSVSMDVAKDMAQAVRRLAKTDFGIGITGVAGPTGGSPQKPIGTVFIAVSSQNKTIIKEFHFAGNRDRIRNASALKALELLKTLLVGG
ncbi:MAG: CinA family protein [Candidatus Omnitrophota bacterium]